MNWHKWEDFAAGMYGPPRGRHMDAYRLLTDPDGFAEVAAEMVREWPNAARHNLAHLWTGRNAWLGQASCCYSVAATGLDTRTAWGMMTNDQQRAANLAARTVRDRWERTGHAEALPFA